MGSSPPTDGFLLFTSPLDFPGNVQSCQDSFTMAPPSFRYQTNDEMRTLLAALLVAVLLSITSSSTSLHKQPAKQTTASSHLNSGIPAIIHDWKFRGTYVP